MLNIRNEQGVILLEALVGLLIFSIGILGMVALQAAAISQTADAKYRSSASLLANQIIGQMWGDRGNLAAYSQATGGGTACNTAGTPSGYAPVTAWLTEITGELPGATPAMQTINISGAANNVVTVTVCWKGAHDSAPHNYVAVAQLK